MPTTDTRALGARGELLAAQHLQRAGYAVLERNWRCAAGEIDIVARIGSTVVVVEVKTRAGTGFGHPLEAITREKLSRLRRLALLWCEARGARPSGLRLDVIGIVWAPGRAPVIDHLQGIG